jgi:hypothetical protein
MSGNIILDSMKKKETIALAKLLEAVKVLGKADPDSTKILTEAEKELGIGTKKKRETGEIKFTLPPHDLRSWLDTLRRDGIKPKSGTLQRNKRKDRRQCRIGLIYSSRIRLWIQGAK